MKRRLSLLLSISILFLAPLAFSQLPVNLGTGARVTAAWTSATSIDTTLSVPTSGMGLTTITLNPTSTFTGGTLNFEASDDAGTTWYGVAPTRFDSYTSDNTYVIAASTKRSWSVNVAGFTNFRVRINPAITGTGTANLALMPIATGSEPDVVVGQSLGSNLHAVTDATSETNLVTTATTTDTALRCTLVSAASTNATNCKASAGNVYGFRFVNTTATLYYLRMYNSSSAPTCSSATGFIESIPIPASATGAGIVAIEPMGEGYSTGIGFCFTGGSSSTDNTNAATGVFGTILYK